MQKSGCYMTPPQILIRKKMLRPRLVLNRKDYNNYYSLCLYYKSVVGLALAGSCISFWLKETLRSATRGHCSAPCSNLKLSAFCGFLVQKPTMVLDCPCYFDEWVRFLPCRVICWVPQSMRGHCSDLVSGCAIWDAQWNPVLPPLTHLPWIAIR